MNIYGEGVNLEELKIMSSEGLSMLRDLQPETQGDRRGLGVNVWNFRRYRCGGYGITVDGTEAGGDIFKAELAV